MPWLPIIFASCYMLIKTVPLWKHYSVCYCHFPHLVTYVTWPAGYSLVLNVGHFSFVLSKTSISLTKIMSKWFKTAKTTLKLELPSFWNWVSLKSGIHHISQPIHGLFATLFFIPDQIMHCYPIFWVSTNIYVHCCTDGIMLSGNHYVLFLLLAAVSTKTKNSNLTCLWQLCWWEHAWWWRPGVRLLQGWSHWPDLPLLRARAEGDQVLGGHAPPDPTPGVVFYVVLSLILVLSSACSWYAERSVLETTVGKLDFVWNNWCFPRNGQKYRCICYPSVLLDDFILVGPCR